MGTVLLSSNVNKSSQKMTGEPSPCHHLEEHTLKILIIGGTYFLGKAFAEVLTEQNKIQTEIYLLNRGNRLPENTDAFGGLYIMDRHDEEKLSGITECFDVIVDFCAYRAGDIETILKYVKTKHYIFVSTTDVYKRGTGQLLDEKAEYEDRDFGGTVGQYILGKVSLEKEMLRLAALNKDTFFTSLRPVFIYGPGNYAPRESMYFKWMLGADQILHPSDSDGCFQMVYVKDAANAIWLVINHALPGQQNNLSNYNVFNICDNALFNYDKYADLMNSVAKTCLGKEIEKVEIPVSEVMERGIPLPFPLTKATSERYSGERLKALGFAATEPEKAMEETFADYINLA